MVHLVASVGCVLYTIVSWNLSLDSKEDKRNINNKIKNLQRLN